MRIDTVKPSRLYVGSHQPGSLTITYYLNDQTRNPARIRLSLNDARRLADAIHDLCDELDARES